MLAAWGKARHVPARPKVRTLSFRTVIFSQHRLSDILATSPEFVMIKIDSIVHSHKVVLEHNRKAEESVSAAVPW
jgi:ABC-type Na+ transport system ATPase subunit NatA